MSSSDKNTLCLITMSLAEEAGMLQYCSPAVTERSTYEPTEINLKLSVCLQKNNAKVRTRKPGRPGGLAPW